MQFKKIGNLGEEFAKIFLEKKGYKILGKNYHSAFGEIDLIARNKNELVFVEVKTRKTGAMIKGEDAVDKNKIQKIIKTVFKYLEEKNLEENTLWRIDVVVVESNGKDFKLDEHIENVAIE